MSVISNIFKSKIAAGIEIVLLASGEYEINAVVVKNKKQSLVTEKQVSKLKSIKELAGVIDPKAALVIILNGKGIIHRKVGFSESDSSSSLLNKVLPNANSTDFCIQRSFVDEQHVFVSIIRSEILNLILEELKENKFVNVAGCLLGPFVLKDLIVQMEHLVGQLNVPGYSIEIRDKQIVDIAISSENTFETLVIGGEAIAPEYLIPFGGAVSFFTGQETGIENSDLLVYLKDEYKEKQKFELAGWTLLLFCFTILGVNYFLFSNYWNKNNDMNAQLSLNQSAIEQCDTLKEEYAIKKNFLEQNGLLENSRTSFYADRLAESLPASIHWTEVVIHPAKRRQAGEEETILLFEKKIISITGKCQKSTELNDWMKEIKKKEWIADVGLLNYTQDKRMEEGIFSIQIKLR